MKRWGCSKPTPDKFRDQRSRGNAQESDMSVSTHHLKTTGELHRLNGARIYHDTISALQPVLYKPKFPSSSTYRK